MERQDAFSSCHPAVNFIFFALVLLFSMCLMHPVCLTASMAGGCAYAACLRRREAGRFGLVFVLPTALAAALLNPLFNHEGATILAWLPWGNPLTLESVIYGLAAAAMLACVLIWFSCFHEVVQSDKLVWLFGRLLPSLSLVLSMALRFVPRFTGQMKKTAEVQRLQGLDVGRGGVWQRSRADFAILSAMLTWSFENAVETADSMRSRGYGLKGRTSFSIYRMSRRDWVLLCWMLFCAACLLWGWTAGLLSFRYFPTVKGGASPCSLCLVLLYLALCLTPVLCRGVQSAVWARRAARGCAARSGTEGEPWTV